MSFPRPAGARCDVVFPGCVAGVGSCAYKRNLQGKLRRLPSGLDILRKSVSPFLTRRSHLSGSGGEIKSGYGPVGFWTVMGKLWKV